MFVLLGYSVVQYCYAVHEEEGKLFLVYRTLVYVFCRELLFKCPSHGAMRFVVAKQ